MMNCVLLLVLINRVSDRSKAFKPLFCVSYSWSGGLKGFDSESLICKFKSLAERRTYECHTKRSYVYPSIFLSSYARPFADL